MKTLFTLFTAALISYGLCAQTTAIPDSAFEQELIDAGLDMPPIDGVVPTANIAVVLMLAVDGSAIIDLTGIEAFLSLTSLNCGDNDLTSLNLSSNTLLTSLTCGDNVLTSLDLSSNTALTSLNCDNNSLISLDVSKNTQLDRLDCSNNHLVNLNVQNGNNINMTRFDASSNPELTCVQIDPFKGDFPFPATFVSVDSQTQLNVSSCPTEGITLIPDPDFEQALIELELELDHILNGWVKTSNINTVIILKVLNADISDLTGIAAFTALEQLWCGKNQLTNLDVSLNGNLVQLHCEVNQLTSLDVSNGNNNNMTDFNTSINSNLTCIEVDDVTITANWTAPKFTFGSQTRFSTDCRYCESSAIISGSPRIEEVTLGGMSNSSGNNDGYEDFTNINFPLSNGTNIALKSGFDNITPQQGLSWVVRIDYNQDGDLDDFGELVFQAEEKPFLRGDANDDNKRDVSDMAFIAGVLFQGVNGGVFNIPDAADANDDGAVDHSDIIALGSHLFGGVPSLPEPFLIPGLDPTDDDLGNVSGTITVPKSALSGTTRMRIQAKVGGFPAGPCEQFSEGQVEDYTVTISALKLANNDGPSTELDYVDHLLNVYEQALAVNTFPNPSDGLLNIEVTGGIEEDFAFKVMSFTGQVVYEGTGIYGSTARVDLGEQPKGIYFIQVRTSTEAVTKKLLLQ